MDMSKDRTPFGLRMYEARKKATLTQAQVAKAMSVAQSTLSGLESTAYSSGRTAEFAQLYKCDGHWLATGKEGAYEALGTTAATGAAALTPGKPLAAAAGYPLREALLHIAERLREEDEGTRALVATILPSLATKPDEAVSTIALIGKLVSIDIASPAGSKRRAAAAKRKKTVSPATPLIPPAKKRKA